MKRLLPPTDHAGLFHVTSRVVDRRLIFGDEERARFLGLAKALAEFGGLDLVSWAMMGNHFHLLVRVPPADSAEELAEAELIRRLPLVLPLSRLEALRMRLAACRTEAERGEVLEPFRVRVASLPTFMKVLKHRFSVWYNRRHERAGTLWENRYHSVLLEHERNEKTAARQGLGPLARVIAAYIDLNPVRAKVVDDPAKNDWTSYGALCRGDSTALRGLRILWGDECGADEARARHRAMLAVEGSAARVPQGGPKAKRGAMRADATGSVADALPVPRVKVEAWARARVLGSASFVRSVVGTPAGRATDPDTEDGRLSRSHMLATAGMPDLQVFPCPRRLEHRRG